MSNITKNIIEQARKVLGAAESAAIAESMVQGRELQDTVTTGLAEALLGGGQDALADKVVAGAKAAARTQAVLMAVSTCLRLLEDESIDKTTEALLRGAKIGTK